MRFEDPTYLYLLFIIPFLFLLRGWMLWKRRQALRLWGDPDLTAKQMPEVSRHRPMVKFCLITGAVALIIVMLARPQMGSKISNEKRTGIEAIICLDISNSMLAEDVTPSRLEKSKLLIENMVDNFTNDKIGLVVFAGDAFTQLPITADYVSAKMFLQNTTPSLIEEQGTDIAKAISLAQNSFTQQKNIGRAIIVITDGEDHEGGAMEAAKAAKKAGMRVFILGIGSTSGAPIPTGDGGHMTDNSGQTVMTALNEQMCKEIAAAGSGTYIHVDNTNQAQEQLNGEIAKMQKNEISSVVYSEYNDQFQVVGLILILLLILEVVVAECKTEFQKRLSLFKRHSIVLLLLVLCPLGALAQSDRALIREGNRQFHAQEFEKAEATYRKAVAVNPKNPEAQYNLGCALMAQQKDSAAVACFEAGAQLQPDKMRRAQAYHNMGVICQQKKMFGEAIEAYKQALRNNPKDNETRYNLALCMKQKKNDKNNQQNKKNKDDKKNKQDQDKQNQNKNQDQKKDDKQQQQQQQKEQMSKENAEQLLNAAMQQEKATQQKMKKAQQQPRRSSHQKNW